MTATRAFVALTAAAALSSGCVPLPYAEDTPYYRSPAGWLGEGWIGDSVWTEPYPASRSIYYAPSHSVPVDRRYEDRVVYLRAPRHDSGRRHPADRDQVSRRSHASAGHPDRWDRDSAKESGWHHDHPRAEHDRDHGDRGTHDTRWTTRPDQPSQPAHREGCADGECSARWRERVGSRPYPRGGVRGGPSRVEAIDAAPGPGTHASEPVRSTARDPRAYWRRQPGRVDQAAASPD
jgi:hypothetical protein